MAAYGAKIAAANALNGDSQVYDNAAMPSVVFTDPQVASVGLTEAMARDRDLDVATTVLPLDYLPRALAARDTRGLRSEEHTSELQSLMRISYAVFCLNKKITTHKM